MALILPNPLYLYAGAAALAIAAFGGYKVRDWQCDAALAKALERAQEQRQEIESEMGRQARTFEAERDQASRLATKTATTIREVYREIPAVPIDCVPPDSVVSLLARSRDLANSAATGQPSGSVPRDR